MLFAVGCELTVCCVGCAVCASPTSELSVQGCLGFLPIAVKAGCGQMKKASGIGGKGTHGPPAATLVKTMLQSQAYYDLVDLVGLRWLDSYVYPMPTAEVAAALAARLDA